MFLNIVRPPIAQYPQRYQFTVRDYVAVHHVDVRGTYKVLDMVSPEEAVGMAALARSLEREGKK